VCRGHGRATPGRIPQGQGVKDLADTGAAQHDRGPRGAGCLRRRHLPGGRRDAKYSAALQGDWGQVNPSGRQPFFSRAEEKLLVRFIKLQAVVGCGLTRVGFLRWVGEYVALLSFGRQSTARAYFSGKLTPGVAFYRLFMRRWPGLQEYRVGTLEQGHFLCACPRLALLGCLLSRIHFLRGPHEQTRLLQATPSSLPPPCPPSFHPFPPHAAPQVEA